MILSEVTFPLSAGVPDWLALAVVVASILLAILTVSLTLLRLRPSPDEEAGRELTTVRDPVLLLSAVCVVALAITAWLLR